MKAAVAVLRALLPAALSLGAAAASTSASASQDPAAEAPPLASKPLYSQGAEESIVRDFFRDRTNGFFVDVGAAWPIQNSNTYYLENHLGWTGIAIDALPEYGPSWEESRPRSRFYSYFVTDHSDTIEPFYRSASTGVSSYQKEQARGPSGELAFEEIQVPSITLTSLLEKNGVTRIDFLSMDIEGAELMALAGFDIERFRPELVCIEAKAVNRKGIFEYFGVHGYERIERYAEYDQTNYYFKPRQALVHDPYREPPPVSPGGSLGLLARSALALAVAHVLPGILLLGILGLDGGPLKRWTFAAVLGGPLAAAIYLASLASGWPSLYWVSLAVVDLGAVYLFVRDRRLYRLASPGTKQLLGLLGLLLALASAYLYTTGRFFRIDRGGQFTMDPAFTEDALFHTGLVEALQTAYPARLLSVSGARAYPYHVGYHLQVAGWQRFFGVDRYDGIYRVGVLWSLGLLVFAAYSFGLRFSKSPAVALIATALLFGSGLGFLFYAAPAANWWSLVFMDAAVVSLFLINPLLPALPLLFVGLACLDDYLERGRGGDLAAAVFAMIALVTVKEILAGQVLAGIVLASALARGGAAPRAWRAALALCLASAPLLSWSAVLAFRDANERLSYWPLEIVRYSMETVGAQRWVEALTAVGEGTWRISDLGLGLIATTFWLAGFLGLRLAGARGVVRDAISRSGSMRSGLAWFVLIGFPLTLLCRIAPADVTALSRQEALNAAFWFATFSGVSMWLWTAEALSGLGRRGWRARALVWTGAALLAFPATVQHFVYKDSISLDALSFPPNVVGALAAGRSLSGPEDVFVEPLKRFRPSLPAYLAGRPVVYEPFVRYDDRWVPRDDLEYRRHAVAQFWSSSDPGYGSWFLSRFGVRWIYTPPDVLSPQAGGRWATPVFANDAATIYRVGELPEAALDVPGSLPLGTRGASFFGEGWGARETSRRSRRLAPGRGVLYIPSNERQALRIILALETPHASGSLGLGDERAVIGSHQNLVELHLGAKDARRGLSRLELFWQGADPLVVTGVRVSADAEGPGSF